MVSRRLRLMLFVATVGFVAGERLQDKMYSPIQGAACFRRMNGTHSTGCTSAFGGSVGVLHMIESVSDFSFVLNNPPAPPYTLIVPPTLFTRENIMSMLNGAKGNVAGILLINNSTNLTSFSQESRCPNQYGGLLKEQTCDANRPEFSWNPFGTGLLLENFPFPIYYVKDDADIRQIVECYHTFNKHDVENQHKRSLCSVEIKTFMSAAVSSEVCIRRSNYMYYSKPMRYCDPLQGHNVYTTLFSREVVAERQEDPAPAEDFIVVATRMDTTSMFDGLGVGAMDSLLPFVTGISVAHTLNRLLPRNTSPTNVLFMFFNGESYDYIGSQRLVYDLEKGLFPANVTQTRPIAMEDIKLLIDIGSLDNPNGIAVYRYNTFPLADQLAKLFKKYIDRGNFEINSHDKFTKNLPPTSSQSFLRQNLTFPAVILYSDLNKNHFYHSVYDDERNIRYKYLNTSKDFSDLRELSTWTGYPIDSVQMAIRNVSTMISFSLYELLTGREMLATQGANPYLIDELLYCFMRSAKCPLFKAATQPDGFVANDKPPQRYISVSGSMAVEAKVWTFRVLGLLVGDRTNEAAANCTLLPLSWYAGYDGNGACYRTKQNFSDAYSPAFDMDDYDWASGRYSTWTESTWREINARIFLKPSIAHEAYTLSIGVAVLFVSFVLVFLISSRSDILFGESTASERALTTPAQC